METMWDKYTSKDVDKVFKFVDDYKEFISNNKTEREFCSSSLELAKKNGFKDLLTVKKLKTGDKVYIINRNKEICLFVVGKRDIEQGLNVVGAHMDSPRLDIKMHPLYEDHGIALLDTHYYGGIKKYQWVAHPMSLHGVVCKKDGTTVNIKIGEKEDDPVFGISDLLVHLAKDQMAKKGNEVIEGEDLNVTVGSMPLKGKSENKVKEYILDLLKKEYDIEEKDFESAELEVVPSGKARDYGLDRSMVMAYGQDDKVCAYTSLRAILDIKDPEVTACCMLVDKEEVGSQSTTGMHSRFFQDSLRELINLLKGDFNELMLARTLRNSKVLSTDVTAAFDPNYPSVNELKNTAFFGKGVGFAKYTGSRGKSGSNDACAEYIAKVRNVMDKNKVGYQFAELGKVDQGGGGTIAYIFGNLNMDVIDAGTPVQNMHACYEVTSKADIYESYHANVAFFKDMK